MADLGEALDPLHPGLDRRDDWLIDVCTRRVLELVCCCCFLSFGILDLRVHVRSKRYCVSEVKDQGCGS